MNTRPGYPAADRAEPLLPMLSNDQQQQQQQALHMSTRGSREAMLSRNGASANMAHPMGQYRHPEFPPPPFPMQPAACNARDVEGPALYSSNATFPAMYDPYGVRPTDVNSSYHPLARSRKDGGYGLERMDAQQLDYGHGADPWMPMPNVPDACIQNTARPPMGMERNPVAGHKPLTFTANQMQQQRLAQQQSAAARRFMSGRQPSDRPRANGAMMRPRPNIDEFFSANRTGTGSDTQASLMRHMHQPDEAMQQSLYPNKLPPSPWAPQQGARPGGMVSPGVPAPYDRLGSVYPSRQLQTPQPRQPQPQHHHDHSHEMRRHMMQQMARNERSGRMATVAPELQQMERFMQAGPFMQDTAPYLVPPHSNGMNASMNVPSEAALLPFKSLVRTHYHPLQEALSTFDEAQKTMPEGTTQSSLNETRMILKYLKSAADGKMKVPAQRQTEWLQTVHKKAAYLVREAKQIKARLESPQSINSTVNTPIDAQDETPGVPEMPPHGAVGQQPSGQRTPRAMAPEMTYPHVTQESRSRTRSTPNGVNGGSEVIVIDGADEPVQPKRGSPMRPVRTNPNHFRLDTHLRPEHPPFPSPCSVQQQPSPSKPQPPSRKREAARRVDDAPYSGQSMASPHSRNIRPRPNPTGSQMPMPSALPPIQVPTARLPDPGLPVQQGVMEEQAASSADRASAASKLPVDDDLFSGTDIGSLMELLDGYEGPDNWKRGVDFVHGLKGDDCDDWIYSRRVLETVAAQGPAASSGSKMCESIEHLTFIHDSPVPSGVTEAVQNVDDSAAVADMESNKKQPPSSDSVLCQRVQEECDQLQKELSLGRFSFKINSVPDTNIVEVVVVEAAEDSQNKPNDSEEGHAIKLLVGPSYPGTAPDISFSVLPNNNSNDNNNKSNNKSSTAAASAAALNYYRNVFLSEITDCRLEGVSEILRVWFSEICSSSSGSSSHHHSVCGPTSSSSQ